MARAQVRFVVNPISGVGRQRLIESAVDELLDTARIQYEICYTEGPRHATQLAREAAAQGYSAVVAVGGDGSVNEVGQGLCSTETALGVVPTGSGNGLARHLGLPMDVRKAVERLNALSVKKMDTVELNNTAYLGVAGVGFDAHIAHVFDTFGTRGFVSYARLVLREINQYKPATYTLRIDGVEQQLEAFIISVANASQYGNGARIAPMASITDGLLDVCIIKPFPAVLTPEMMLRLFRGTLPNTRHTQFVTAQQVEIEQQAAIAHMDGEPIAPGQQLRFSIKPLSLNVLT